MKKNKLVYFQDLGKMDYQTAFEYQTRLFEEIKQTKISNKKKDYPEITHNYFLFTEHPHTYTLGKSGKEEHLLIDDKQRQEKSVVFIKTNRGGDITYHGPGQIVGYPIIDLDNFDIDIIGYIRMIEEVIIKVLSKYGIKGERIKGETGVWIDATKNNARKICAIGVKTSRWVTMHGFALNVNTDLSYFNHIIPCGIRNKGVTSLQKELGKHIDSETVKKDILQEFEQIFLAELVNLSNQ
jgi:lipoyl(octanoyl) transferase